LYCHYYTIACPKADCGFFQAVHDGKSQAAFIQGFAENEIDVSFIEGAQGFAEMLDIHA